ncbi:MAG: tetratricopeptide repeat protein [Deltaproteobacteria bacterium]|nr:tetratricopeptide repeat protein [Deltaproteobacteria bacterium]
MALYQQGKYAEALDKFDRANKLFPAPTLAVRAARCLVELGRLVEASERFLEVTRLAMPPGTPWQQIQAQRDAKVEREKLTAQIPSLRIDVNGPRGEDMTVTVDGKPLPEELLGEAHPIDPGDHEVEARRADAVISKVVSVVRGQAAVAVLDLPPLPPAAAGTSKRAPEDLAPYQVAAITALAIGATGVLAGSSYGVWALSLQADLEERCPNRDCPPEAHGAADTFDVVRAATTIGFVLGGLGLATGTGLLLLAPGAPAGADATKEPAGGPTGEPSEEPPAEEQGRRHPGPRLVPWLGVGGAGLAGRF